MKLPGDVSGRQAVGVLRKHGFLVVRQVGSHVRMKRRTVSITVPQHPSIAPKTLQSILRQAGISVEDFVAGL